MQDRKRQNNHTNREGIKPAGSLPHGSQKGHAKNSGSLDAVVTSLKETKSYKVKLGEQKNQYEVETCLKANHRKWIFCSYVKHKGKEVTDEGVLCRVEQFRNRATQAGKTKILWERFVEEAATTHLEKVQEVKVRLNTDFRVRLNRHIDIYCD